MNSKKILCFFILLITTAGYSQEIITDRPDKTESVQTVGKNRFQIEAGIEYSSYKIYGDAVKTFTAPTVLFRYGILKNIELRLNTDFENQNLDHNKLSMNPPVIGAKVNIFNGGGFIPYFSILGEAIIPNAGSDDKQIKHFVPEIVLLFSDKINERLELGYNIGIEWSEDLKSRNLFYSASLGIKINSKWNSYIELYGDIPTSSETFNNSNQYVDAGVAYLLKNNIQLDAYTGFGLSTNANDFIFGTGISFKF